MTARSAVLVLLFTGLTTVGAHVSFPLPGAAVPVTLQTLFVTLSGALLGARLGAASQMLYLLLGIAGLPMFASGTGLEVVAGPAGGYLLAFPLAAVITAAALEGKSSVARGLAAFLFGSLIILAIGWLQLALHTDALRAWRGGVVPFMPGAIVKIIIGALIVMTWRGARPRTSPGTSPNPDPGP